MNREGNILSIKDLEIGYSKKSLAQHIFADLKKGKLTAIMGMNGCGKSTLIKTIARLNKSIAGDVLFDGKSIFAMHPLEFAQKVALVLTDKIADPELKVEEVVSFGRSPHTSWTGKLSKQDKEIINRSVEQVGMQDFMQRNICELSDGEMQRVLIAKALAQDTSLMILDEPSSHLDIRNKLDMIKLLRSLCHDQGLSILFSSHELDMVLKFADEIWLFDQQANIHIGKPQDFLQNGLLKKVFGEDVI